MSTMRSSTPQVVETILPGVGIKYELTTRAGIPLSLIVEREGGSVLVAYDSRDPDRASLSVPLDDDETEALAGLLNGASMVHRIGEAAELPGVTTARVRIDEGAAFDGLPLGEIKARTLTGCSIVAIVRGVDVITSPGPEEVLHGRDLLVVVGTGTGLYQLREILWHGP
ncbi:MAG: cation:proton antiporter regulatory subunit [Actinobacteria bacterium]|nr:cation:proton antiporter regulatory subunit [Actinomycetota bacterium]